MDASQTQKSADHPSHPAAPHGQVAIIVLNWNGCDDTIECLQSLARLDYADRQIVVVDNGSSDDSVSRLQRQFPDTKLIALPSNLGFAQGNNVGIKYALAQGADYIFLLNNDTIVDPPIINRLLEASRQYPQAGVFGAKIYYYNDPERIWYAGARWLPERADFEHVGGTQLDNGGDFNAIGPTAYACGCALFASRSVWQQIGLLPQAYYLLFEEADWCYQARRQGLESLFVPQARVWHKVSAAFQGWRQPTYQYYYWRNRLLFIERNWPRREALRIMRRTVWGQVRREWRTWHNSASLDERLAAKAGLSGVRDYLLRRFGAGSGARFRRSARQ